MFIEQLNKTFRNALLFGCSVNCPVCEKSFRTFLPHGINKRENAQCVNCGSLERHRLLWLFFNNDTQLFTKPCHMLHVAPTQALSERFRKHTNIKYLAVDKFAEGYTYDDDVLKKDITNLSLPDNCFDVIICNHVLEHIISDTAAMSELYRVLKPGGWGVLQVPLDESREETFEDFTITDPGDRERLFGQKDHVRVYGKDYVNRLKNAGFIVEVIDYSQKYTEDQITRYGLMKGEKIYLVKKV